MQKPRLKQGAKKAKGGKGKTIDNTWRGSKHSPTTRAAPIGEITLLGDYEKKKADRTQIRTILKVGRRRYGKERRGRTTNQPI